MMSRITDGRGHDILAEALEEALQSAIDSGLEKAEHRAMHMIGWMRHCAFATDEQSEAFRLRLFSRRK